ncbi:NACHT domain- and WD repeat-containing protein 1 [Chanos chanos]|uniref:NACHT domain- and WD repeat-containing protein 1 n=1 Tax=Chanos chanos TaxID=29144 RepID=A0A6J2W3S4_CHACN|nr:NACHT domain- and WD repeat-containing protein 1 [Chanos chanos]
MATVEVREAPDTGALQDQLPSRTVRLFISSTFKDMSCERNAFWEKVYPELQTHCQSMGLVLEVVDLRWGVNDAVADDHMTSDLCLHELQACQRAACHIFIALLGNQYGYRPIPRLIPEREFEILLSKLSSDGEGLKLLNQWFQKDSNSVPPVYVLQPISTHYPHFGKRRPERDQQSGDEAVSWQFTESRLSGLLRSAALQAQRDGDFSEEQKHKFIKSVIEWEIEQGILGDSSSSAVVFVRELPRLKKNETQKNLSLFLDLTPDGLVDAEAQELLVSLKQRLYSICSDSLNLQCVELSRGAVDPSRKEHKDYLRNLSEQLVVQIKGRIEKCSVLPPGGAHWDWWKEEFIHHAQLGAEMCVTFSGREGILGKICLAMWEATNKCHAPLVLYGSTGSGKTALLCQLAQEMRGLIGSKATVVLRLLGTSPRSCDVESLLFGLCLQICRAFGMPLFCSQGPNMLQELTRFFLSTLWKVSAQGNTLLLILDSLHQLLPGNGAHSLHWLPREVPPNVHLLVSTQDVGFPLLQNLRHMLEESRNFFELESLTRDEGRGIVETYMRAAKRVLTAEQSEAVLTRFQQTNSPLHLRLMLDAARHWTSYTAISNINLGTSAQEVMTLSLESLEERHGKHLVGHALSYIVASKLGLSEAELRDVLSLDDEVLADIYRYQLPSCHTLIRLPSLRWTRLKHDLGEHLTVRRTHGVDLLRLRHRQFSELIRERYLSGERRGQVHAVLAEYFLGNWAQGRPKSVLLPSVTHPLEADRKVPLQPLWLAEGIPNHRKLQELPYHLICSRKWEELQKINLSSVDWLWCKTQGCGVDAVIQDLTLCCRLSDCPETQLLRDTFQLLKSTLDFLGGLTDPALLYTELLARLHCLSGLYPSLIGRLCGQCQDWFTSCPHPVLLPKSSFLPAPGGALTHTLTSCSKGITAVDLCSERRVLVGGAEDGILAVWSLDHFQVVHSLTGHKDGVVCVKLLSHGRHCLSSGCDGTVRRWDLERGRELYCISEAVSLSISPFDSSCISPLRTAHFHLQEDTHLLLTNCNGQLKAWNLDSGKLLYVLCETGMFSVLGVLGETVVLFSEEGQLSFCDSVSGSRKTQLSLSGSVQNLSVCGVLTLTKLSRLLLTFTDASLCMVSVAGIVCPLSLPCPASFLCASVDEKILLTGCKQTVAVFHVKPNTVQMFLQLQHEVRVQTAALSSHVREVITAAEDHVIRVWSLTTGNLLDSFNVIGFPVTSLMTYNRFIVSASIRCRELHLWSLDYNSQHRLKACMPPQCPQVTLSKDGDTVYFVKPGNGKDIFTWSSSKGLSGHRMQASADVCCLELAQQKQLLMCGLTTGTILIYPLTFAPETLCLPPPENLPAVRSMAVNLREDRLAVAYEDAVCLFEITSRDSFPCVDGPYESFSLSLLQSCVSGMALLPDCRLLYGTITGDVALYDFKSASATELGQLGARVTCVALSTWGTHALIGSQECVQQLWSLSPLLLDHMMEYKGFCFEGAVCASFSVNDKYVFTGSLDRTVKVWEVSSGTLLCVQFVYSPVVRMMSYKDGFVAVSQSGCFVREGFRCPDNISREHNPLQNFRAHYTVKSRLKTQNPPHTVIDTLDYNPAQFNFTSVFKTQPSNTCSLL